MYTYFMICSLHYSMSWMDILYLSFPIRKSHDELDDLTIFLGNIWEWTSGSSISYKYVKKMILPCVLVLFREKGFILVDWFWPALNITSKFFVILSYVSWGSGIFFIIEIIKKNSMRLLVVCSIKKNYVCLPLYVILYENIPGPTSPCTYRIDFIMPLLVAIYI